MKTRRSENNRSQISKDSTTLGDDTQSREKLNFLPQCSKIDKEIRRCAHCRKKLLLTDFPRAGNGKRRYQCRTCFYEYLSKRNRVQHEHKWKDSEQELTVTRLIDQSEQSIAVEVLVENLRCLGYLNKRRADCFDPLQLLKRDHAIISSIGRKK